jgi:hypothetical protein
VFTYKNVSLQNDKVLKFISGTRLQISAPERKFNEKIRESSQDILENFPVVTADQRI